MVEAVHEGVRIKLSVKIIYRIETTSSIVIV